MRIPTLASMAALSLAAATTALAITGFDTVAMANNGNGGGHGGGNGGGSHGSSGSSHSKSGSGHGNSNSKGGESKGKSSEADRRSQFFKSGKTTAVATKDKKASAHLASLNSLNRNYKAYLHTSDPKMAAISAYAVAYAQYELDNGTEPSVDDPLLGDEALRVALASATRTGEVAAATLDKAKSILGVGDADGKIDQIRATLTPTAPAAATDPGTPTDPVTSTEPTVSDEGATLSTQ